MAYDTDAGEFVGKRRNNKRWIYKKIKGRLKGSDLDFSSDSNLRLCFNLRMGKI